MPLRSDIKKVLVIGSGPILIGQGGGFFSLGGGDPLPGAKFPPSLLYK